jgi:hypothetical protein
MLELHGLASLNGFNFGLNEQGVCSSSQQQLHAPLLLQSCACVDLENNSQKAKKF